jgi:hypothetical protein
MIETSIQVPTLDQKLVTAANRISQTRAVLTYKIYRNDTISSQNKAVDAMKLAWEEFYKLLKEIRELERIKVNETRA